jgi:murein DD-endopeptidase MepM/ murein hydrolase activator NlpD
MHLLMPVIGFALLFGSAPILGSAPAAIAQSGIGNVAGYHHSVGGYPTEHRSPAESGPSSYLVPIDTGAVRVLTGFHPPATRYGRGHLGVDLAAAQGTAVVAAGGGVVRFAGPVAGRDVVVLMHPDGISTEYEPVAAAVAAGQRVVAGERIGIVRGVHRGCSPADCLHWGARRGDAYLDPMSLLEPLGVVRLLPWS